MVRYLVCFWRFQNWKRTLSKKEFFFDLSLDSSLGGCGRKTRVRDQEYFIHANCVKSIMGKSKTWKVYADIRNPGSIFNGYFVELWPSFSCWILITLLNFDTFLSRNSTGRGVRNPRWIVTPGQNSTLNCDLGSKFHVELWPRAGIPHWIVIPISCHNLTLNHDSGSQFNVEFRPES